jgi:ribosomal-protein-serine acetyltransferase
MPSLTLSISEHTSLRTFTPDMAAALFTLTQKNHAQLLPWLAWVPYVKTVSDSQKYIEDSLIEMDKGVSLALGIWHQDQLVGCLDFHEISAEHHRALVGYWLDRDQQGHGLMTRSVKTLMTYGFATLGFNRIEIRCAPDNHKSRAIPEKLGFTQEGILRQMEKVGEKYLDDVVYGMLKTEWPTQTNSS